MSLTFNDTSTFKGIIQTIEKECGFNQGDVSGDTAKLKQFTADVNMALDDFFAIAIPASGKWQFDDSNHTSDYPVIYTNLVSGQRDYSFTTDGTNLVLDIYKVAILPSATSTLYQEIDPIDASKPHSNTDIVSEATTTGTPVEYDKLGNGIFLNPIPSYNATNGLKVYVNREASYFAYTDTTKKPGVPGLFHRYFAIKPAMEYARRKGLNSFVGLRDEVLLMERAIEKYFSGRERDVIPVLETEPINYE